MTPEALSPANTRGSPHESPLRLDSHPPLPATEIGIRESPTQKSDTGQIPVGGGSGTASLGLATPI